jgi:acyl carrier protein
MTEVIKRVMSQILGVEASDIVADSSPETIERWDSLKHMQLIMALEDELGIQFPDEVIPELINFATIETTTKELSTG